MANTLKLEIVTPEAKTYSEDVDMVTLPGVEGEMGIYPLHVPLMTQIVAGEVSVRKGGQDYFLDLTPQKVDTILEDLRRRWREQQKQSPVGGTLHGVGPSGAKV